MNSTKTVFLDLYGRNRAVRVWVKQYDTGRKLRVVLRCDGQPCPASLADMAVAAYTRPDGQTQVFLCTVQADGSILAPIPGWATQYPGTGFGCISVIGSSDDRHTTLDLVLQVEEGEELSDIDVTEDDDADILTQLISSVSELRESYLAGIAELENRPAGHDPEVDAALLAWMGTVNGILTSLSQAIAGIKRATFVYGIPEGGTISDIIDLSGVSAPSTADAVTKKTAYEALLQNGSGEDDDPDDPGTDDPNNPEGGDDPQEPDEPDNPGGGDDPDDPDDPDNPGSDPQEPDDPGTGAGEPISFGSAGYNSNHGILYVYFGDAFSLSGYRRIEIRIAREGGWGANAAANVNYAAYEPDGDGNWKCVEFDTVDTTQKPTVTINGVITLSADGKTLTCGCPRYNSAIWAYTGSLICTVTGFARTNEES